MDAAEKRTALAVTALLAATVLASTVLHHGFPRVFNVPSNAGVPHTGLPAMFLADLVPVLLAGLCFLHAWRRLGPYLAVMFLAGSFFFTGLEENVWVFIGRYMHLLAQASPELGSGAGTYYFTRGFFWWFEIPAYICLGWFFIAYACVHVSNLLLRGRGIAARAALGGFLAMNFDLWLDPVQVHPAWRSWVWLTNEPVRVLSIPLTNFAGWFLLIFLFALAFDRLPGMLERLGPRRAPLLPGAGRPGGRAAGGLPRLRRAGPEVHQDAGKFYYHGYMTAMDERKDGWIDYLPMAAFLGYWLYAGLLAALATGDRRLLLLGLITLPALAAMAAAVRRTARGRRLG